MTVLSDLIAFYHLFLICVCAFTRFDIPVFVRLLEVVLNLSDR